MKKKRRKISEDNGRRRTPAKGMIGAGEVQAETVDGREMVIWTLGDESG